MLITKVYGPDIRACAYVENLPNLCARIIGRRCAEAIIEGADEKIVLQI